MPAPSSRTVEVGVRRVEAKSALVGEESQAARGGVMRQRTVGGEELSQCLCCCRQRYVEEKKKKKDKMHRAGWEKETVAYQLLSYPLLDRTSTEWEIGGW